MSERKDKEKDEAVILSRVILDYSERTEIEIKEKQYWNLYFNESWTIKQVKDNNDKLYQAIFAAFAQTFT